MEGGRDLAAELQRAKALRKPIRANITKTIGEAETELTTLRKDDLRLQQLLEKLQKLKAQAEEKDKDIQTLMLDSGVVEEEFNAEYEQADSYQDKIALATKKMEVALVPATTQRPPSPSSSEYASVFSDKKKNMMNLTKIPLKKFDGDRTKWLEWWAFFDDIHENEDYSDGVKFNYLAQCMAPGSRAEEVVSSYPRSTDNYAHVIKALQEEFGDKEILADIYVRKLLDLMMKARDSKMDVATLYHSLLSHLRNLETLGVNKEESKLMACGSCGASNQVKVRDSGALFLFPLVESSLSEETLNKWQQSPIYEISDSGGKTPDQKLDYLIKFLEKEKKKSTKKDYIQGGLEEKKEVKKVAPQQARKKKEDPPTASSLVSTTAAARGREVCFLCDKANHSPADCFKASTMSFEERKAKAKGRCYKCLKKADKGHFANSCRSQVKCLICGGPHHLILCKRLGEKGNCEPVRKEELDGGSTSSNFVTAYQQSNQPRTVLMKTLHVIVKGPKGERRVRLLFDDGSQDSYVRSGLAEELGFTTVDELQVQNLLFGGGVTKAALRYRYRVPLEAVDQPFKTEAMLIAIPELCLFCPIVPPGPWISELHRKKIHVTDTYFDDSPGVDILIGSDLWGKFVTGKMQKLSCGLIAVETVFGWTLSGELPNSKKEDIASGAFFSIAMAATSDRIPELWDLETLGIRDKIETQSAQEHEAEVKRRLQSAITRDEEDRIVIPLPFICENVRPPWNKPVAKKRLDNCTAKLQKQEKLLQYDKIFEDWEAEGIIGEVLSDEAPAHYLPHRPVFKDSLTTPVRPVFDASSKAKGFPSLNDCLEKGPNMLELIPNLLLRFRRKKIGVCADIRKAFQMVGVRKEDRPYQRFLWWKDQNCQELKIFEHCRVIFGMNSSPFILAAVIEYIVKLEDIDDGIKQEFLEALYIDNCVLSVSSNEEFEEFRDTYTEVFARAKMLIRQWTRTGDVGTERNVNFVQSVLGLVWNTEEDSLSCFPLNKFDVAAPVTKRSVLASVASLFDPLGLVCPATIIPKAMIQDAWIRGIGWDEDWGEEASAKFVRWYQDLSYLPAIKIPRQMTAAEATGFQIHIFSDASQIGYGAVVYLRSASDDGVVIRIAIAKARLAPVSSKRKKFKKPKTSIHRLELMGCVIGARLLDTVKTSLKLEDVPVFAWTDSTTSRSWILRNEDWGTFVGNRVREIRKLADGATWNHVPGPMNPADLASRGCSMKELAASIWWEGPAWLKLEENGWPSTPAEADEEEVLAELKKTPRAVMTVSEFPQPAFNEFIKNVRVTAWVRRFFENLRRKVRGEEPILSLRLKVSELKAAELDIVREVQERHPELENNKKLLAVRGEDGLLYLKTKLDFMEDDQLFKRPLLLPSVDPLVEQLVTEIHKCLQHAGTQMTLAWLREKFWIVEGRRTVDRVIRRCVICKRFSAKPLVREPIALPKERVETVYAFQTTGVDLIGAISLKGGKKAWIVIYTCAVYRGVHLDIVDSLGTADFIDSFEKFCWTRGRPNIMWSDQGTNFVGLANLLKKVDPQQFEEKFKIKKIKWTLNPQVHPGGVVGGSVSLES